MNRITRLYFGNEDLFSLFYMKYKRVVQAVEAARAALRGCDIRLLLAEMRFMQTEALQVRPSIRILVYLFADRYLYFRR